MKRTLSLKREPLAEIDVAGLAGVVGGITMTCFSCLDYISCNPAACLVDRLPETSICVE